MAWAYRLLSYCATPAVLLYLWWRGRKDPGYRLRWGERLGLQGQAATSQGGVVLHCASVGEVIAARPLIEALLADPRHHPLVLTCTTPTGSRLIRQHYGARVGHRYFPLDLPGAARRFLQHLRPRLVLLLERELWPTFLHQAQGLGIPVALVNARLSARSAASYTRWRSLMAPALGTLRLVCAADTVTAARLAALGVPAYRLAVTGNIKSDVVVPAALLQRINSTRAAWGGRAVLTAGSTHVGEDEALVAAFQTHLANSPQTLLVLVPRHPERFDAVAHLLAQAGLRYVRHSLGQVPTPETQVVLGDSMGELLFWYGVASACFVGGSLIERGGHNPLEVLCLHKPLIAGPHTDNFAQLYAALRSANGMLAAQDADAVFHQLQSVLQDGGLVQGLVARADTVYLQMAGATDRTMAQLDHLLGPLSAATAAVPTAVHRGSESMWLDSHRFQTAGGQLFDPAWWQRHGTCRSHSGGRGQVHFVANTQGNFVLRHYHRGGLVARLNNDLFLAQPLSLTRAMAEFTLLSQLCSQGLPVPRACAARHTRVGIWYRADILVEQIPDATDVAALLHQQRALTTGEWHAVGRAVRQLHEAQVYHSDLNCHNLMLDTRGKAWIVDFDKCTFRAGDDWKQTNLNRLLRSLRKELRLDAGFGWCEGDWAHLMSGYRVHAP